MKEILLGVTVVAGLAGCTGPTSPDAALAVLRRDCARGIGDACGQVWSIEQREQWIRQQVGPRQ